MAPQRFGGDIPQTLAMLSNGNILATEQYMDMFTNRMFRQTLLVKESAMPRINRAVSDKSVRHLHFTAELTRGTTAGEGVLGVYTDRHGRTLTVREPVMLAVADALIANAPFTTSVDDIIALLRERKVGEGHSDDAVAEAIGAQIITLLLQGLVKIRFGRKAPPPAADKPKAFGPARQALEKGQRVVPNTFHSVSGINDVQMFLLKTLDGNTTLAQAEQALAAKFKAGDFNATRDGQPITDPAALAELLRNVTVNTVNDFSRSGLLTG